MHLIAAVTLTGSDHELPNIPSIPPIPSIHPIPSIPAIPSLASLPSKALSNNSLYNNITLDSPLAKTLVLVLEANSQLLKFISQASQYFIDYPLLTSQFGELGKRVQILGSWIDLRDVLTSATTVEQSTAFSALLEEIALSLSPFLKNPLQPDYKHAFSDLRKRQKIGLKGVVIPAGKGSFRFTYHLVKNLRDALYSKLPIQIAYASDADLPSEYRDFITNLGADVETFDVLKVVDDETLQLAKDGWAIKPFAVLTSTFEQVMLLDADAVLLQAPEEIFDRHSGYRETGTLLFHDRLL